MFYTVYRITNLINEKVYVGKHKTENLNDDYFGSGKLIKHAILKYGKENFKKDILFVFDNPADMDAKEAEIVNEEFVACENTYNLMLGGSGGFDYINSLDIDRREWQLAGAKTRNEINSNRMKCPEYRLKHSKRISAGLLNSPNRHKLSHDMSGKNNPMYGKTHSDEIRKHMSVTRTGSNNNMFGKVWIYSLAEKRSMRVNHDELNEYITNGWLKGRKMKF